MCRGWRKKEREEAAKYYQRRFERACQEAQKGAYDVLILDELLAACNYGMVQEEAVTEFLKNRPERLEVVLTGRNPSKRLLESGGLCIGD